MARRRRLFVPGETLHVINRGNNREPIFGTDDDCERFLALLERGSTTFDVAVHAFVLMTTHFHLMATPTSETALPSMMKDVEARYSSYFNRRYDRTGTPWNGRYRALPISDQRYWLTCLRYIEQNPVRAAMVADPSEYRWSTYRVHALGEPAEWIEPHHVYVTLGASPEERQAAYRAISATCLSAETVRGLRKLHVRTAAAANGV